MLFTSDDVLLGSDIDESNPKLFTIEQAGSTAGTISIIVALANTLPPEPFVPQGMGISGACFSHASQSLIHCDDAVANDFCDTDLTAPISGYLRDGVWDGTGCRLSLSEDLTSTART